MTEGQGVFRENLELILRAFPEKRVLSASDVARFTGRGREWCRKRFNIDSKKGISVVCLAKELSQ